MRFRDILMVAARGGGGAVSPAPLQFATTRNEHERATGSAAASGNILQVSRTRHYIGSSDVSEIVLSIGAWVQDSTAETNSPAYTARVDFEIGGVCVAGTFGGASTKAIASGDVDIKSDPFTPAQFGLTKFDAGAEVWVKLQREYIVGDLPTYVSLSAAGVTGETTLRAATGSATKIGTAGTMSTTGGWTATSAYYSPVILGRPVTPMPAIIVLGGSVEYGTADTHGDGLGTSGGYVRRGLSSGTKLAYMNMGKSADSSAAYQFMAKRSQYFKYANIAVNAYGGNDFTDDRAPSFVVTWMKNINAQLKAAGVAKIYQIHIFPKSDSSDSWATTANQTIRTGTNSGTINAFRTALEAGAATDTNCNGVLNYTASLEPVGEPGKWAAPGNTGDGTHPTTAGHGLAATDFRTAVNAIL